MGSPQTSSDIWRVRADGGGAEPIVNTRFSEGQPSLSPDGRWLAYQSDESGQAEVYVQSFAIRGPKVQVSVAGGEQPRWSTDGKRIFYRRGGKFYGASVTAQANITIGRPVEFAIDPSGQAGHFNYDIAADGRLIVAVLDSFSTGQPALMFNLTEAIRQKFASAR
jgi:hypothetical protein